MYIVEQRGDNVLVTYAGHAPRLVVGCNADRFRETLYQTSSDPYSDEEMAAFGFRRLDGSSRPSSEQRIIYGGTS